MGLIDLKHQSEISLQVRDWWTTFDNELHAYACVDGASRVCLHAYGGDSFDQHLPFSIPNLGGTPRRFASDSKYLVGTDGSNRGWVWDRESGSTAMKFESGVNSSGAFSCRGGRLAYLDHDRNVRICQDPEAGRMSSLCPLIPVPSPCRQMRPRWQSGERTNGQLRFGICATETLIQTLVTGKNQLIRWSPDGKLLAVCHDADYWIEVWNLQTGKRCSYLRGHRNGGNNFEFSGDGTVIASAGWDGTARIWDPYSGHELLRSEAVRCEFRAGNTLLLIHPKRAAAWKYRRSPECRTFAQRTISRSVFPTSPIGGAVHLSPADAKTGSAFGIRKTVMNWHLHRCMRSGLSRLIATATVWSRTAGSASINGPSPFHRPGPNGRSVPQTT